PSPAATAPRRTATCSATRTVRLGRPQRWRRPHEARREMHVREAAAAGAVGAEGLEQELVRPLQAAAGPAAESLPQRLRGLARIGHATAGALPVRGLPLGAPLPRPRRPARPPPPH